MKCVLCQALRLVHRNRESSRSGSGCWLFTTFDICAWLGRLVDTVLCIFGHASFIWGLWGGRSESSLKRRVSYVCLKQEAKAFLYFYFKIKDSVAPSVVGWPGLKHVPVFPARTAIRDLVWVKLTWFQHVPASLHCLGWDLSLCCGRSPGSWAGLKAMRHSTLRWIFLPEVFAYCSEVLVRTFMSSLWICKKEKTKSPVGNVCYFRRELSFNILTVSLRTGRVVI